MRPLPWWMLRDGGKLRLLFEMAAIVPVGIGLLFILSMVAGLAGPWPWLIAFSAAEGMRQLMEKSGISAPLSERFGHRRMGRPVR